MKFGKVLPILFKELQGQGVDFAMIGGVALYAYGIERTTFDIDFMIFATDAEKVDAMMQAHGYRVLNRTATFANYVSDDADLGQVDFMYAQKERSTAMLRRAEERWVAGHNVKVLQVEDVIGLKVLSLSNNPKRASKDQWDIEDLMRRYHRKLDWQLVRDYFKLFGREAEFKRLKRQTS